MKKIIISVFILLIAKYSFAQFTNVKDTVFATMPINSTLTIPDTLFNLGATDIPIQWNVGTSTFVAPGHSGVSVCSFPGACHNFNNDIHSEIVPSSSTLIFLLSWEVDATAAIGSTSYVILNTNINGGKNLVRKITVSGPLSTEELYVQSIKVYPIPSTDILNVEIPDKKSSKIEIVNISGLVVNATPTFGKQKTELSISNLNPGLYFLNIFDAENKIIVRKKIIKN